MIVAEDKLGKTEYVKDIKLIISTYRGRVDKAMSFDHLGKVIEFYKNNEVKYAIINLLELYGSFAPVMEYLESSFYPVAIKSGLKAQAIIVTDDLIIKNLTNKLKAITSRFSVDARTFATKEEAMKWLKLKI